ncbi:MAG: V-type ATP synthase subunit F [Pyrobaculum sp.]
MHIVLGDRYTVALFKLMGFEGKVLEKPEEVLEFIIKHINVYDVVFITSNLARQIKKDLDDIRIKYTRKLFVEVPSVLEGMEKDVNYLQIVRQVLGG